MNRVRTLFEFVSSLEIMNVTIRHGLVGLGSDPSIPQDFVQDDNVRNGVFAKSEFVRSNYQFSMSLSLMSIVMPFSSLCRGNVGARYG